jgi:hypothetical protein
MNHYQLFKQLVISETLLSSKELLCSLLRCNQLQSLSVVQLLFFWTLSVVHFLFKMHNVSDTGFSLLLQTDPKDGWYFNKIIVFMNIIHRPVL